MLNALINKEMRNKGLLFDYYGFSCDTKGMDFHKYYSDSLEEVEKEMEDDENFYQSTFGSEALEELFSYDVEDLTYEDIRELVQEAWDQELCGEVYINEKLVHGFLLDGSLLRAEDPKILISLETPLDPTEVQPGTTKEELEEILDDEALYILDHIEDYR